MMDIILSADKKQDLKNILYLLQLFKNEIKIQPYKIYIVVKNPPDLIFFIHEMSDFPGCHFLTRHHTSPQQGTNPSAIKITYENQVYHKSEYSIFIHSSNHSPQTTTSHDLHKILNTILHRHNHIAQN